MKCPGCGRGFDMCDLGEVVEHIHDAGEIETEKPRLSPREPNR
jgi:hypothetical protein